VEEVEEAVNVKHEGIKWARLLGLAEREASMTLRELPVPLRKSMEGMVFSYEPVPGPERVAEGIESDALGLFVGRAFPDEVTDTGALPPQVILFLRNIWDEAGGDEDVYREEIRTTILHEIGHFLGLDEEDLFDRELE
jgi:predicted Zn-dependent protease with MMP-like domain